MHPQRFLLCCLLLERHALVVLLLTLSTDFFLTGLISTFLLLLSCVLTGSLNRLFNSCVVQILLLLSVEIDLILLRL